MRYITVEGMSFQYDSEPVLDNIHYHLDSGELPSQRLLRLP